MRTSELVVAAIPREVVEQLLHRDDAGRRPRLLTETDGGNALRCCLRTSRAGEELALLSYAPLRRWAAARGVDPGAYDETGPVLVHAARCAGPSERGFPEDLRNSPRVLRAYSAQGTILRGVPVPSYGDVEGALAALLADPDVAVVHARAAELGCFTFEVRRAS